MPVIATQNMKQKNMFNMMEFTSDEIFYGTLWSFEEDYDEFKDIKFKINNDTFDKSEFRMNFLPNFCNTVYKYQGGKIDDHYNIWDTHRMDVKEMNTSLTRTTKLEYVHLDNKKNVNGIENVSRIK